MQCLKFIVLDFMQCLKLIMLVFMCMNSNVLLSVLVFMCVNCKVNVYNDYVLHFLCLQSLSVTYHCVRVYGMFKVVSVRLYVFESVRHFLFIMIIC